MMRLPEQTTAAASSAIDPVGTSERRGWQLSASSLWQHFVRQDPALRTVFSLAFGALALTALVHRKATQRLKAEIGTQLSELATHVARTLHRSMFERMARPPDRCHP